MDSQSDRSIHYLCLSVAQNTILSFRVLHGKKFGTDAAPSGRAVAFTEGELCDYTFGYAAFHLWMSSCSFFQEQLTYVEGTQRPFR